ncbi:MAG: hypothetical protein ACRERD_01635 [Candidatus Binatia bacterium]
MRIRRFLHVLLFACALLLLWQVVVTWSRTQPVPLAAQSPITEPPLVFPLVPAPEAGRELAKVIADKDLFSPTRSRATVEGSPTTATIPPPSHLKLVGVILLPGREEAFFADSSQGGKVSSVRQGETIGSYRLAQVTSAQATLVVGQNGEEVSLPLLVLDSGTAAKAPRSLLTALTAQRRGGVPGRPGQVRPLPTPTRPGQPLAAPAQPLQAETQAIRQNIQQLHQRLRQIRKQAVRESRGESETDDEEDEEEEEEEDEE